MSGDTEDFKERAKPIHDASIDDEYYDDEYHYGKLSDLDNTPYHGNADRDDFLMTSVGVLSAIFLPAGLLIFNCYVKSGIPKEVKAERVKHDIIAEEVMSYAKMHDGEPRFQKLKIFVSFGF